MSEMPPITLADVMAARHVLRGVADATPFVPSPYLSDAFGREVLLKLELAQATGAFKLRGAMNAIAGLSGDVAGVICCSTGNHGRGVSFAAVRRGLRAVVCMSELVPRTKIDGIAAVGGEPRIVGRSQDDAEIEAKRLAKEEGLNEIPPFDDPRVIAGQGTIGLEMLESRPDLAAIIVPLSGGGLAGGVALAAKAIRPDVRVIGVTMDRGAAMQASIAAGRPVEVTEMASLADSLGGGIGMDNRYSFALCRDLLDEVVLVTEDQIYHAMQTLYYEDRLVAEGASVVGIAAMQAGLDLPDGPVATIITGRNPDMVQFSRIMAGQDVVLGEVTVKGQTYGA